MTIQHSCTYASSNDTVEITWDFWFIINGVIMPVAIVVGLFGNLALLMLFCKTKFWKGLSGYIVAIALWDQLLLFSAFWLFTLHCWKRASIIEVGDWLTYSHAFSYFIGNCCFTGHIYATVALTIERFLAICYPLWHRAARPKRLGYLLESIAVVMGVAFTLPRYFEVNVFECFDTDTNRLRPQVRKSWLLEDWWYVKIYRSIVAVVCTSFCPFLILFILTLRMVYEVSRSTGQTELSRRNTGNRRTIFQRVHNSLQLDKKCNRPLVIVLLKSLVCYTLPTVNDWIEYVWSTPTMKDAMAEYLVDLSDLLVILDASAAFFTYFMTSRKFRVHFMDVIMCRKSPRTMSSSVQTTLFLASNNNNNQTVRRRDTSRSVKRRSIPTRNSFLTEWFNNHGIRLLPETSVKV